jgi:oligoribonuclease (3'-5' exoribonuclease)
MDTFKIRKVEVAGERFPSTKVGDITLSIPYDDIKSIHIGLSNSSNYVSINPNRTIIGNDLKLTGDIITKNNAVIAELPITSNDIANGTIDSSKFLSSTGLSDTVVLSQSPIVYNPNIRGEMIFSPLNINESNQEILSQVDANNVIPGRFREGKYTLTDLDIEGQLNFTRLSPGNWFEARFNNLANDRYGMSYDTNGNMYLYASKINLNSKVNIGFATGNESYESPLVIDKNKVIADSIQNNINSFMALNVKNGGILIETNNANGDQDYLNRPLQMKDRNSFQIKNSSMSYNPIGYDPTSEYIHKVRVKFGYDSTRATSLYYTRGLSDTEDYSVFSLNGENSFVLGKNNGYFTKQIEVKGVFQSERQYVNSDHTKYTSFNTITNSEYLLSNLRPYISQTTSGNTEAIILAKNIIDSNLDSKFLITSNNSKYYIDYNGLSVIMLKRIQELSERDVTIYANSIGVSELIDSNVTLSKLDQSVIDYILSNAYIDDMEVTSNAIKDSNITLSKINQNVFDYIENVMTYSNTIANSNIILSKLGQDVFDYINNKARIDNGEVTSNAILESNVTIDKLHTSVINYIDVLGTVQDNEILTKNISDSNITLSKLNQDVLYFITSNAAIQTGEVVTNSILNSNVTLSKLNQDVLSFITSNAAIQTGEVVTNSILNSNVTLSKLNQDVLSFITSNAAIQTGEVVTNSILNSNVTLSKLNQDVLTFITSNATIQTGEVVTNSILDSNVTLSKLNQDVLDYISANIGVQPGEVVTNSILDSNVTLSKLNQDVLTFITSNAQIQTGEVVTNSIQNSNVTLSKLNQDVISFITSNATIQPGEVTSSSIANSNIDFTKFSLSVMQYFNSIDIALSNLNQRLSNAEQPYELTIRG